MVVEHALDAGAARSPPATVGRPRHRVGRDRAVARRRAAARRVEVWATDVVAPTRSRWRRPTSPALGRPARRVRLAEGDWFDALPDDLRGSVDVVVRNPPYVAASDPLPAEVARWEPPGALVAGPDRARGDRAHRREAGLAAARGVLVVEIGETQGERGRRDLAAPRASPEVAIHPDLAGRDRPHRLPPPLTPRSRLCREVRQIWRTSRHRRLSALVCVPPPRQTPAMAHTDKAFAAQLGLAHVTQMSESPRTTRAPSGVRGVGAGLPRRLPLDGVRRDLRAAASRGGTRSRARRRDLAPGGSGVLGRRPLRFPAGGARGARASPPSSARRRPPPDRRPRTRRRCDGRALPSHDAQRYVAGPRGGEPAVARVASVGAMAPRAPCHDRRGPSGARRGRAAGPFRRWRAPHGPRSSGAGRSTQATRRPRWCWPRRSAAGGATARLPPPDPGRPRRVRGRLRLSRGDARDRGRRLWATRRSRPARRGLPSPEPHHRRRLPPEEVQREARVSAVRTTSPRRSRASAGLDWPPPEVLPRTAPVVAYFATETPLGGGRRWRCRGTGE